MTTVHISLGRDDGTTKTAAKGVVEWEPTTRREDGTMVILERGFTVPLVAGEASVTVDPSGLTWCWRVTERTDSGGVVRYVAVPDSAVTVEYVDLPDVDPDTLLPWTPADPEAAYQSALDNLDVETAVETYLLANPVSAPVSSVNGEVGAVVLDADDVGADPAGTAAWLVSGLVIPDSPDDIGAAAVAHTHAPGDVTGTAVITTDPRLFDARTPTAHTHTLAAITDAGDAAGLDVGTTAGTVAAGDHDHAEVYAPVSHTHTASQISDSTTTGRAIITAATATAARTAISAAPALGSDDNYVTDEEKAALHSHANKTALDQVSGINTGDQVLPTWSTIDGKPAVVAAGATQADARTAIGAGTSNLVIGTTAGTAKEGNYAPDLSGLVAKSLVDAKGDLIVGTADNTPARLAVGSAGDSLTPNSGATPGVEWGIPLLKIAQNSNTSITPALTDHGKYIELTATTAVTITLPQDSAVAFPIGSYVIYKATTAAGLATFQQGTGATLRDYTPSAVMRKEGSSVQATKVASNTWTLDGDLATP